MPISPRPDQLQALAEGAPNGSLYMLNLLKFKDKAEYADGRETDLSGAEAYGLYAEGVGKILAQMGGRLVFGGRTNVLLIGDGDLEWDQVAIVEYPNVDAFRQMTASEEYQAIHVHREAGLEHQLLINCLSAEQVAEMTS
ncbi:MAG: DUF1330 domain-containing protein [Gammaproteobacteria bacterium]|nr:DUF1330 domain-containing protein [Gammaproteobacteria bacterium]